MAFPPDLEAAAFRANGEYAWRPADVPRAVQHLAESGFAILGGEGWTVIERAIYPSLPASDGSQAIWTWTCNRQPDEPWETYVARSAEVTAEAIKDFSLEEARQRRVADFYFNLAWASETEYAELLRLRL